MRKQSKGVASGNAGKERAATTGNRLDAGNERDSGKRKLPASELGHP